MYYKHVVEKGKKELEMCAQELKVVTKSIKDVV